MRRRRRALLAPGVLFLIAFAIHGCAGGRGSIPRPDLRDASPEVVRAVQADQDGVVRAPRSAQAWGKLGDRYRSHRWMAEAEECYLRAAAIEPREFLWPYLAGINRSLTDPKKAAEFLASALKLDDSYAPAHVHYARALLRLGRQDEARGHFERASLLDPNGSHAELGLGQIALASGDYASARQHLELALQRNPRHAEAHLALAKVLMARGEAGQARVHADAVRELPNETPMDDPRSARFVEPAGAQAHMEVAQQLWKLDKLDEAAEQYRQAIQSDPNLALAHFNLGTLLAKQGKLEEAEASLRQAVQLDPDDEEAQRGLASVLYLRGKMDEAAEHLRTALNRKPADTELRYNLGTMLAMRGDLPGATEQLSEVVRLRPDHAEARVNLAAALAKQGKTDQAVAQYREALQRQPDHARAHKGLADLLLEQGDTRKAVAEYREAMRLKPDWPEPARRLAWVLATDENPKYRDAGEAVRLAEQACAATSRKNPFALDTLAAAYAEAGRFEEAVTAAREALEKLPASSDAGLSQQIRGRLALYGARRPFRERPKGQGERSG